MKICYPSCLNSWINILDPARKRQVVTSMKIESNKVIYPGFDMNVLGGCRDGHYELTQVALLTGNNMEALQCVRWHQNAPEGASRPFNVMRLAFVKMINMMPLYVGPNARN